MVKKALLCAAALSFAGVAGVAHADELSDLKKLSEQLKQQNQQLMQRIDQLEQRQNRDEAQISAQAAQPAAAPAPQIPAADGSLTWKGVTLYGGVDLGVAYQSHGTPLNTDYGPGLEYMVSKNGNKSLVSFAPNALSYSNLGIKGEEELFPGLKGIFNVQSTFVPTSGAISDGLRSQVENNGIALNKQTSNGDSSRAGQPFNGAAYIGLSSDTYGTLTVGRQNALTLDGVIAYDPMGASNAFSVIGYQGATAGVGDTEDARLDSTLKYRVNIGPVRAAALYQLEGYSSADQHSAYQFQLGTDYMGFSADAIYSQTYDAVSTSALSAAQLATAGVNPNGLSGTISDNWSYMLLGSYKFDESVLPLKLMAGFEHIQFDNPDHPVGAGTSTIGGYDLTLVNNAAFTQNRVLEIYWGGGKWAVTPALDLIGAYYHEYQNSFFTNSHHQEVRCDNTSASSCAGNLDAFSLVADYKLSKRFDLYGGFMYSEVSGGLENGFLFSSSIDPTVGARFRF